MRAVGLVAAIALTLVAGSAAADDSAVPSQRDVREAQVAARDQASDVASVQADLVLANQRLQLSSVRAAQAAEAWNGARFRLAQARDVAMEAEERSAIAVADVERQQDTYADALVTSYQLAPTLNGVAAILKSDGIETVVERTTTLQGAEEALDGQYDEFRAASTLADVATQQAMDARATAQQAQVEARGARDAARVAADAAASEAAAVAHEKDALISELARLQDISRKLAERRQSALEAAAAEAAAEAAAQEASQAAAAQAAEEQAAQEQQEQQEQEQEPTPAPQPTPTPTPQPPPTPQPTPTPAPAAGASAAIAFARAQIGEPYRWGAAGPSAWDCSGLTMGAWEAGGKSLPHYSVAQYEVSVPISAGALRPGDLVFWGSSSSPSSIYHMAMYVGGGQIIHAPRTGRDVTEESMYYWIPPNFYARP